MLDNPIFLLIGILAGCLFFIYVLVISIESYSKTLILIFTFSFFQGVIQLMGIPTIVPRFILELAIMVLFLKTIYLCQKKRIVMQFKWGSWMASIFAITIFSAIINKQDPLSFLLFCRHTFIFYLLFVTIYNTSMLKQDIQKINRWIIGLLVIQIPAAIIKLFVYGRIVEGGGIGTISVRDGSAALLISLIPISFLFSKYLYKRKVFYLILCLLFLIVSIASGKRATGFVLPIMLSFIVLNYLFLENRNRIIKIIKFSFGVIIMSLSILYITSQTSVLLNPEGRAFSGAFDLGFMYDRMMLYTFVSEEINPGAGRGKGLQETYNYISSKGTEKIVLGFGPGSIIESFLVEGGRSYQTIHNLSYGSRSGFIWFFLQIGLLGALLYLLFIINWFFSVRNIYKLKRYSQEEAPILLGIMGCIFLLLFDFSFYSTSFIANGVTMPVLLYLSAIYLSPLRP